MSKFVAYIVLLCIFNSDNFAQDIHNPGDTINIEFRPNSRKLNKSAKSKLDSVAILLISNAQLGFKLISSTKDNCDRCGTLAWKRTRAIYNYLTSKVSKREKYCILGLLNVENNKIAILVGTFIAAETPQPHPSLKNKRL
jgi:hypothetical protein